MLNDHVRFQANDELAILNAISMTEITAKKLDLYKGMAKNNEVKKFFETRAIMMKKTTDDLRKHLDRIGGA